MNGTHPTAEVLDRYRRRAASPAETLAVDAHVAECDRCFERVRADAHLTFDELVALADGRESSSPHLSLCARCRRELADLNAMRAAMQRPASPRTWLPFAAAAMLAVVAGGSWMLSRTAPPPPAPQPAPAVVEAAPPPPAPAQRQPAVADLERPPILDTLVTGRAELRGRESGTTFNLQAPVATVVLDDRPKFRWEEVSGATGYEVTVIDVDRGTAAATGTCLTGSWQPISPLRRGETYAWQVAVETDRGRFVSPGREGAEARFHVAEQSTVEGTTPLERGVALARLGALDDAERELASAGATDLLDEVRSWRGPQRALPTTTNGAQ